jgi:hypothetical protein
MNRISAITCPIDAIADHIVGREVFSLGTLCEIRDAILNAHDVIADEILKREGAPVGTLSGFAKPDGGAA